MLPRLIGLLAIVAIKELSEEAVRRITRWMKKHGQEDEEDPLN